MKNRIEKSNMARFDYTARTLGIVGLALITVTLALGGTLLVNQIQKQQTLMNAVSQREKEAKRVESQNSAYVIIDVA